MPRIAAIPGDGVGKEVIAEAIQLLEVVNRHFGTGVEVVTWPHGADRYLETGSGLTDLEIQDLRQNYDGILLGALGDPRVPRNEHAREILLGLRFKLDLFINFRPVRLLHERLTPLKEKGIGDIDFVIFRENTEGVYVGMGGVFKPGTPDEVAIQEDVNTRRGVERIVRAAFEFADVKGLERVTMSDKANAMEHAGGLWRRVFAEVGEEFPSIEKEALYVDMLAMDLIRRPERYQVIVTGNLFGDILSDLGAQLVGGLGISASANLHPGRTSLFEPVHGSAPDLVGKGVANPVAAILSAALLLDHLGFPIAARAVEKAVEESITTGEVTPDLGGRMSTRQAGDAIRGRIAAPVSISPAL
jgi:3-isopropylmalate dehydrogenase